MGGDYGPSVIVPGALRALQEAPNLKLILVGDEVRLRRALKKKADVPGLIIHHASETVAMNESPAQALRYKKDSSMRVAINLVKEGKADACVSAGNTGALMATARFVLKTLPSIDRPAITTSLPCTKPDRKVRMLDLGANVDSSAEQLYQFALMGSVVAEKVDRISFPKVALLNIGAEEIKGNEQVKRTAALLTENDTINYIGYIEGNDIYKGIADVVVCDGFVGNIALKSSEGTARLIAHYIRTGFSSSWYGRVVQLLVLPILKQIKGKMDPAGYNGASLVGLQGIVVKSHGSATSRAFANAIHEASLQVQQNVPQQIKARLAALLQKRNEK